MSPRCPALAAVLSAVLTFLLLGFPDSPALAASLDGLGDLAGGVFRSEARAVSADGRVVVGQSAAGVGQRAFRWDAERGIESLGEPRGDRRPSHALAVSADGAVVAGELAQSETDVAAFRWTREDGMQRLAPLDRDSATSARAVSGDGTLVGGWDVLTDSQTTRLRGFFWTSDDGTRRYPGGPLSAMSEDASTVLVGDSRIETDDETFQLDPPLDLIREYRAEALSGDGRVAVGSVASPFTACFSGDCAEALRWRDRDFEQIDELGPGSARAVSRDGTTVVGRVLVDVGLRNQPFAFVWTGAEGQRLLADVLAEDGVDLDGWELHEATGVSADGRVIVGNGRNPDGQPEAWRVTLPEPDAATALAVALAALASLARRGL